MTNTATPRKTAAERKADKLEAQRIEAQRARTNAATERNKRKRRDRMALELAFYDFIVFDPETVEANPGLVEAFGHLAVQAPKSKEELGPPADVRHRSK